jgi:hypothetical protein
LNFEEIGFCCFCVIVVLCLVELSARLAKRNGIEKAKKGKKTNNQIIFLYFVLENVLSKMGRKQRTKQIKLFFPFSFFPKCFAPHF